MLATPPPSFLTSTLSPSTFFSDNPFEKSFLDQPETSYGRELYASTAGDLQYGSMRLLGSIPGSPASFLATSNTSEAREDTSIFEDPKSPSLKLETPEGYDATSELEDGEGSEEAPRKKVHREIGFVLNDEEKRQRFLERNRRAAQRCRQKKKDMIEKLHREATDLERGYQRLVREVEASKVLNSYMLALLTEHKECPSFGQARSMNPANERPPNMQPPCKNALS